MGLKEIIGVFPFRDREVDDKRDDIVSWALEEFPGIIVLPKGTQWGACVFIRGK